MAKNSQWRLLAVSDAANKYLQRTYTLKQGENRIGRSSKIEIPIPSMRCSRNHCTISVRDNEITLIDTVSKMLNKFCHFHISSQKYIFSPGMAHMSTKHLSEIVNSKELNIMTSLHLVLIYQALMIQATKKHLFTLFIMIASTVLKSKTQTMKLWITNQMKQFKMNQKVKLLFVLIRNPWYQIHLRCTTNNNNNNNNLWKINDSHHHNRLHRPIGIVYLVKNKIYFDI